ncbi:hypothetical protein K7432_005750 [Basidiobolus ranarum]|uniref:Uncharacterized protein n=1 Tax=Basidiobolus ranarum TaxID=34480 RepID=A0ABR2WW04_9FUNG
MFNPFRWLRKRRQTTSIKLKEEKVCTITRDVHSVITQGVPTKTQRKSLNALSNKDVFVRVIAKLKDLVTPLTHEHEKQFEGKPVRDNDLLIQVTMYWWGFEVELRPELMDCLSKEANRAVLFFGILSTVAMLLPPIQPFVRVISAFVGLQFALIQREDHGFGVILTATWALPFLLVPIGVSKPPANSNQIEQRDEGANKAADTLVIAS